MLLLPDPLLFEQLLISKMHGAVRQSCSSVVYALPVRQVVNTQSLVQALLVLISLPVWGLCAYTACITGKAHTVLLQLQYIVHYTVHLLLCSILYKKASSVSCCIAQEFKMYGWSSILQPFLCPTFPSPPPPAPSCLLAPCTFLSCLVVGKCSLLQTSCW